MAESASFHVSLFAVDGTFMKRFGAGSPRHGCNDVTVSAVGDVIVTDSSNNRVSVYSPDGGTLLRCWGSAGDDMQGHRKFVSPKAVAISRSQLVVMDHSCLQVFH